MQEKTVERLSQYRRLLREIQEEGAQGVFSHDLAALTHISPSLVRRDLMDLPIRGVPQHGYDVAELLAAIEGVLDGDRPLNVALVGVGQLGRALLSFYINRPKLRIVAAFDTDPQKVGRLVHGCRVYDVADIPRLVRELEVRLAILSVPAQSAQATARALCDAGVGGLLNFAPVRLRVPEGVQVEDLDFTTSLEKLAFFVRKGN